MKCYFLLIFLLLCTLIHATNQQEKITINWNEVIGETTNEQFGTNDFLIDDAVAAEGNYREILKELNIGFFRFHNEDLTDHWTSNITKTWNTTLIKLQFENYLQAYGVNFPTIIMTIPRWPLWLSNQTILDPSLYSNYTALVTELVKIINIDLGMNVLYWEPFNELDNNYRAADKLKDMFELYSILSQAMTKVDTSIKVGGPAWASSTAQETIDFLTYGGPRATSVPYTDSQVLADTTKYVGIINKMITAARSVKPGIKLFMDEFNVFYNWRESDPRIFKSMGAVWYASLHRIVAESGLTGSANWNARDSTFGFIDNENLLRYPAYIFKWSNTYFVGSIVNSTTTNTSLEVMSVYNKEGASVYVINKSDGGIQFSVSQVGDLLGSGSLLLSIFIVDLVNASGPFEGLSIDSDSLSSGVTIEPESVWCIHKSS